MKHEGWKGEKYWRRDMEDRMRRPNIRLLRIPGRENREIKEWDNG